MALTKANSDVVDIPDITVSLQTDTTAGGLGVSKANLASPTFTGTPTLVTSPSITTDINSTRIADNTFYNNLSQSLNVSGGTNIDFYPHGYTMDENHDAHLSSVRVHYITEESYYVIVNTYFQEGVVSYTTSGGFSNADYKTRNTYSTCYYMSPTGLIKPTTTVSNIEKLYAPISPSATTEKNSCRVATTGNITLSNSQTIDGIAVVNPNRVLVKNQTTASENGIYVVTNAGAWTRATDADTAGELPTGSYTYIEDGTANVGTTWTLTSGTIGSSMTFSDHSGSGAKWSASITIGSSTYLAVAYSQNSSGVTSTGTFASNTYVYKWNTTTKKFDTITNVIPTNGAEYVEFFQIGTDYFLAVCNHVLGTSYAQSVKIYKWDGTTRFGNAQINPSVHQTITANGPIATRKFQIGSTHYLAVANARDSSSDVSTNSFVYAWNTGTSLFDTGSPTFTLATTWCTDVDFFQIGTDYFLTFSCYSSSSTPKTITSGVPDGITNSFVCKWNGSTFTTLQTIKTELCNSLRYFNDGSGTSHYIIASSNYDVEDYLTDANGPNDTVFVKVYLWNSTLGRFSEGSSLIFLNNPQRIIAEPTINYISESDYLLCVPQTSAAGMDDTPVYNFSKSNLLIITRKS